MILYLDANVILARYAPDEAQHEESKQLILEIEEGKLKAVTSLLTLLEIVSTTSRVYERFGEEDGLMGREEVAGAFLRRTIGISNLDFIPMGGDISVKVDGRALKIPATYAVSLEIGSRTGVKTLDNIHLAAASIASRIYGESIDYFVTLDEDIMKHRKEIESLIDIEVARPDKITEPDNPTSNVL